MAQQYAKQTSSPVPENIANFAHFYVKVHEILERCIVWLYFYERPHLADAPPTSSAFDRSKTLEPAAKKQRRDFARALNRLASRLMFTLNRLEDAIQRESFPKSCLAKKSLVDSNISSIVNVLPHAEELLSKIARRINKAKKDELCVV